MNVGVFGQITIKNKEEVNRITSVRVGEKVRQEKELITPASTEVDLWGGGYLELECEERLGIGFCIGSIMAAVGMDVGVGFVQNLTFDVLTGTSLTEPRLVVDTIYNRSGLHFTNSFFVDFEIFTDFAGEPLVNHRIRSDNLKWPLATYHGYVFPELNNKATTGTYTFDYSDPSKPIVHHNYKIVFEKGYAFEAFDDDVFPVLLVYKKRLDSNPEVITPYNYTGRKSKNSDGCYPFEPKEAYYYKCDSDPRSDYDLWFSPALMYKDGRIDEFRTMQRKWGGIVDTKLKHLELYQKSSNEKDDTKHLFDKDWDFYHIDDIIEVTYVPWDYLKVGYIINVVDAKSRNVIKNSDVYVMGFFMDSATDKVTKPGVYKVSFDIGIPSDGREHPILQNVPSIKTYPILTVQPYWEIIDQETLKYKTVMGEEKSIKLQFPYTTDYSYKKANFTTKITQPVRQ